MPKVLICDPMAEEGLSLLRQACQVVLAVGQNETDLVKAVSDVDAIVVRSETKITAAILRAAPKLCIVGRAGVGVDNIDVKAATAAGVVVVNSPEGNTIAAAEHTFALLLAMARSIPQANQALREGRWDRKKFTGREVYQKTLGILGFGKIGSRVAGYARQFGMRVIAYDPFVSADIMAAQDVQATGLETIFKESDFISLHLPKTEDTKNLINQAALAQMKPSVGIINCARGGVVNEADAYQALSTGKIGGAAFDVFEKEPNTDSPLIALPTVITTPHLGASTAEAQVNVAIDVAQDIVRVLSGLPALNAVNIPSLKAEIIEPVAPFLDLSEKLGLFLAQLAHQPPQRLDIKYHGELAQKNVAPLTLAFLKGFLKSQVGERVNFVNAALVAKERSLRINETRDEGPSDYVNLISATASGSQSTHKVAGTQSKIFGDTIVSVDGFKLNAHAQGILLVIPNQDVPGMVAKIATYLGDRHINIAGMTVGRAGPGREARMILNIDEPVTKEDLEVLAKIGNILGIPRQIQL